MHRMHHSYSDTKEAPNSPHFFKDVFGMMMQTKKIYQSFVAGTLKPEPQFQNNLPVWESLDRFGDMNIVRFGWGTLFCFFYLWLWFFFRVSSLGLVCLSGSLFL